MKTIKAIYKAPVTIVEQSDCLVNSDMQVSIKYNGKYYFGMASCHPSDMDFFSKRVGFHLALSRARIAAMKDVKRRIAEEVYWKGRTYMEITQGKGKDKDGNLRFPEVWRNYYRATKRLEAMDSAIKNAETNLSIYISEQTKAIDVVRRFRNKDKTK